MFTHDTLQQFLNQFDKNNHVQMLSVFIASFEKHYKTCDDAAKSQDVAALLSTVHDVKSLCYTLEANEAGALAEKMEDALKSGDCDGAFHDTPALLQKMGHILTVMKSDA